MHDARGHRLADDAAPRPERRAPVTVRVRRRIGRVRVIWIVVAVLIVATFAAQLFREAVSANTVVNLFDSDQKLNFPSTAKLLLMLAATLLFACVGLASTRRATTASAGSGMSVIFGLVTLDEFTYMHQRLSDVVHDAAGTHGALRFAWVLVYLPLLVVVAVVYLPFWRTLDRATALPAPAAAVLFAGGSGGIELVKGAHLRRRPLVVVVRAGRVALGLARAGRARDPRGDPARAPRDAQLGRGPAPTSGVDRRGSRDRHTVVAPRVRAHGACDRVDDAVADPDGDRDHAHRRARTLGGAGRSVHAWYASRAWVLRPMYRRTRMPG